MRLSWMAVVVIAAAGGMASAAEPAPDLPPGPGHDITVQACLGCHGADVIMRRRLSPSDWSDMVDVMVRYGAMADDQQKAEIAAYLSRVLAPSPAHADKGAPAPAAPPQ